MSGEIFRGRLSAPMDKFIQRFISSIEDDIQIAEIDVDVLEAHCLMLYKIGKLNKKEIKSILKRLDEIRHFLKSSKLYEEIERRNVIDIHPLIEELIIESCGVSVGGKVNTARSRNDQVVTDMHIYLRGKILHISEWALRLSDELLKLAMKYRGALMPGYTHLQHAQLITFSHYALSYIDALMRSVKRLLEAYNYVNLCPLGSCALAGSRISIDRAYTAELLGFSGVIENTIDATSSRDIILDVLARLTVLSTILSRMSKDLIVWSTYEYGFIELGDEVADISTAMPQKKNPDCLEVLIGKTSRIIGLLSHCLSAVYALNTGYSRELQEVKSACFTIVQDIEAMLITLSKVLATLKINEKRMLEVARGNYIVATDLAELLVCKGLAFREAHLLVGNIVKELKSKGVPLDNLTPELLKKTAVKVLKKEVNISADELQKAIDPFSCVLSRKSQGGPSPEEIERMIEERRRELSRLSSMISSLKNELRRAETRRRSIVSQVLSS